jgi:hypothetical protein
VVCTGSSPHWALRCALLLLQRHSRQVAVDEHGCLHLQTGTTEVWQATAHITKSISTQKLSGRKILAIRL